MSIREPSCRGYFGILEFASVEGRRGAVCARSPQHGPVGTSRAPQFRTSCMYMYYCIRYLKNPRKAEIKAEILHIQRQN